MSWSVQFIGTPEKIVEALNLQRERHTGQSLAEYESSLPHLIALVRQNFAKDDTGYRAPFMRLTAGGSGTVGRKIQDDGSLGAFEPVQGSMTVTLEPLWGLLV